MYARRCPGFRPDGMTRPLRAGGPDGPHRLTAAVPPRLRLVVKGSVTGCARARPPAIAYGSAPGSQGPGSILGLAGDGPKSPPWAPLGPSLDILGPCPVSYPQEQPRPSWGRFCASWSPPRNRGPRPRRSGLAGSEDGRGKGRGSRPAQRAGWGNRRGRASPPPWFPPEGGRSPAQGGTLAQTAGQLLEGAGSSAEPAGRPG